MHSTLRTAAASVAALAAFAAPVTARAAGLNDANCKPTAAKPYPVIVLHGQGGNFEGMKGVTDALVGGGYCVYAQNYGKVPNGAYGQDHLATSAHQIAQQIDQVLAKTGAKKVDIVSHSAGTGVAANYILAKNGAAKVHNAVSFGGLHHPYAHAGVPKFIDANLFLPNIIALAQKFVPGISVQDIVKTALDTYAAAGQPLGMIDPALVATAESNFTEDLFDPAYWKTLHGGLEEAEGDFVRIGQTLRSKPTKDAAPNVCYTNIVGAADLVAGAAAGFQDDASNVDNFVLTTTITTNAHNDMLGDPVAHQKMLAGLEWACTAPPPKPMFTGSDGSSDPPSSEEQAATDAFTDNLGKSGNRRAQAGAGEGCSVTTPGSHGPASLGIVAVLGVALAALRRRIKRSSAGE